MVLRNWPAPGARGGMCLSHVYSKGMHWRCAEGEAPPYTILRGRGQSSIDPAIVNTATILLHLEAAKPVVMPPPKPRLDRDPRSRA